MFYVSEPVQATANLNEKWCVAAGVSDSVFREERSCPVDAQRPINITRGKLVWNPAAADRLSNPANGVTFHPVTLSKMPTGGEITLCVTPRQRTTTI
jgi:hypothetical protein